MKDSSCFKRPLQYYCTAGKGLEEFLVAEVRCKLAAIDVDHVTGKVFFSTSEDIEKVRGLKSAERLFLLLRRAPPLAQTGSAGRVEDVVRDQIIGQHRVWTETLSLWLQLRKGLEEAGPDPTGPGRGRKRKLEQGEGAGEGPVCESLGQVVGRGPGVEGQGPGVEGWDPGDKRGDSVVEARGSVVEGQGLGKKRRGHGLKGQDSGVEGQDSGGESAVTGASGEGAPPRSESSSKAGGAGEPQPAPVCFRVCCRCTGSFARTFSSQELGRIVGVAISRQLGWSVNLREPDLEVNVHLSDDHCVIGLPLLRSPLASRSYIRTTGLRSTVAWAMASLAEIKPGSCVLDPMCGVGTILLEAAKECPNSSFLGMDIEESQLQKARDNVQFAELSGRVEVIKSSVKAIPVPSESVDAVVCDIPFGRKFGSKSDMAAALPAIVAEMERVLCVGGSLVLLLSPALAADLKRSCRPQPATPTNESGEPPPPPPQHRPGGPAPAPPQHRPGGPAPAPPQHRPGGLSPLLFPSLELQSIHRVSLGTADALIHKYRKGGGVV
ncbi:THUMP domain-containing protein 2 isoform X1 [Anguilla anguilla]|uniref:THUMP domain-containing protein 2 isoform X1 n=1 Tax=Anguilla anguilla TaxID=7936 RepID=UPI0015ABEC7C|nr:THUMP domain-containing protein 2 isoform X1 [Anguilla anguilla]